MKKKSIFRTILIVILILGLSVSMASCSLFGTGSEQQEGQEQAGTGDNGEKPQGEDDTDDGSREDIIEEEKPLTIWVEDSIPGAIKDDVRAVIDGDPQMEYALDADEADLVLEIVPAGGIDNSGGTSRELDISYVMVLGTSFFSIADGIDWDDFKDWWEGGDSALANISQGDPEPVMAIEDKSYSFLEKILGKPGNDDLVITGTGEILSGIHDGSITFSLIPFDQIDKTLKILDISGFSVFDRNMELDAYPFAFTVSLKGDDAESVDKAYSSLGDISYTNRDLSKLTTMIMTGVTAMVRGTAQRMEKHGITYPGEKIAGILKDADITHISNEVPFVEGCDVLADRFPFFCSRPEYIELLEYVGTDVVELTGNHMNDHGHDWFIYTLEMYDEKGWPYFGGGRDLEESYLPAILESNGNKFAFLGFCWWGPAYDWATEDSPGSAPPHFEEFEARIAQLKQEGYIVIFTFQYLESYQYEPVGQQVIDFRRMIDAGADIVSGSQSHHPQGMEFYNDGFISYGLGNLFFDQMRELGTRQELITKHIFYEGKHINTVIITAMLEDYSQPRIADPQERADILTEVFNASIR